MQPKLDPAAPGCREADGPETAETPVLPSHQNQQREPKGILSLDAGKTEQGPHPAVQLCIWRWLGRGLREVNGDLELPMNMGQQRDMAVMGHGGFVLLAHLL